MTLSFAMPLSHFSAIAFFRVATFDHKLASVQVPFSAEVNIPILKSVEQRLAIMAGQLCLAFVCVERLNGQANLASYEPLTSCFLREAVSVTIVRTAKRMILFGSINQGFGEAADASANFPGIVR
jgi:hypothetical protein